MGLANVAATNMEHLCACDAHGYSQGERWGNKARGICRVECEGHTGTFWKGDRDCSSAVIDAWQEALIGTPYEGVLSGASYTGNMRRVFVESGLFEWKPMSFLAQRGDVYLNEGAHTAMCVDDGRGSCGYDALAEFSINEHGEITGGAAGDQTGRESWIHAYYDFPWDGILHYNGKGDGASEPVDDGAHEGGGDAASAQKSGGYRVGDHVGYNRIYGSSDGMVGFEPCYTEGTITRIVEGARNPYLIDGNIGWVNDDCITWCEGGGDDSEETSAGNGDGSSDADIEALAQAVIRGDYGNGEERRERLGVQYERVQQRVNEMLA